MVEVIIRELEKVEEDRTEVWKVRKLLSEYYWPQQVQVSFNSWGHLVVRFYDEQSKILNFLAKWVKMKEEA